MPKRRFCFTAEAKSDLIEIRRFTTQKWSLAQSDKYLSGLQKTIRLLADSPYLGMSRPEVGKGVLSFSHARHVIYYMVHEQEIVVFGVLHDAMVPVDHLIDRGVV